MVRNAVLILHGTSGEGGSLVRKGGAGDLFAAELFGAGQPLDATRRATSSSCPTTSATAGPPSPATACVDHLGHSAIPDGPAEYQNRPDPSHAERDHLIKVVFPKLRQWYEQRRCIGWTSICVGA